MVEPNRYMNSDREILSYLDNSIESLTPCGTITICLLRPVVPIPLGRAAYGTMVAPGGAPQLRRDQPGFV